MKSHNAHAALRCAGRALLAAGALGCLVLSVRAERIAAGEEHVLVINETGNLWAWGANSAGQLGIGNTLPQLDPVRVDGTAEWTAVAAGISHSLALRADGSLWAWGANNQGQVGNGSMAALVTAPVRIAAGSTFVAISARGNTSFAIRSDGALFGWGANTNAQLGVVAQMMPLSRQPVRIGTAAYRAVSVGGSHVLAIGQDGRLYGWGSNALGQVGIVEAPGTIPVPNPQPRQIGGKSDWTTVAAGGNVSFGIDSAGTLHAWGTGLNLGLGGAGSAATPTVVPGNWSRLSAGDQHVVAVASNGALWGWGLNSVGELGIPLIAPDGQPTLQFNIPSPRDLERSGVRGLAANKGFSVVLLESGAVLSAGENLGGRLGAGPEFLGANTPVGFIRSKFGSPDLVFSSLRILTENPAIGSPILVEARFDNIGSGGLRSGTSVDVTFFLATAATEQSVVRTLAPVGALLGPIGPGQEVQRSFTLNLDTGIAEGVYFLGGRVNAQQTIEEPSFDDNVRFATETMAFQPDAVGSVDFAAVTRNRGQTFPVTARIENLGNAVLQAGLEYRIVAVDRQINRVSVSPVPMGDFTTTAALLPGQGINVPLNLTVPAWLNPALYQLGIIVDPRGLLSELDEENNYRLNQGPTLAVPVAAGNPTILQGISAVASGFDGPGVEPVVIGSLPVHFGGAGAWYAAFAAGRENGMQAQAPTYAPAGSASFFEIAVRGPFRIEFEWQIESEDDQIVFTVDGAAPLDDEFTPRITSSSEGVQRYEAIISASQDARRLRWTYVRGDGPAASVAFVDRLRLVGVNTPDLVVTDLNYNAAEQAVFIPRRFNEYLDVVVGGINAGRPMPGSSNPASNLFEVEVRLTKEKVWGGPDDVVLGVLEEIENLDSGGRFLYGRLFDLEVCIPEGEYYLAVYVDSTQRYEEFNERNNIVFSENRDIVIEHRPQLEVRNLRYRSGIYYRRSEVPMTFDLHNSGCADLLPGQGGNVRISLTAESQIRRVGQGGIRLFTTLENDFTRELAGFSEFNGIRSDTSVPFKASLQIPWYNEPQVWRRWFGTSTPGDNQLLPKFPGFGLSLPVADDELPGVGPYTGGVMGIARNSGVVGGSIAGGEFAIDFVELDPDDFAPSTSLSSSYLERMFTARHPLFFGFEFVFQSASEGVEFIYDVLVQQFSRNLFIAATPFQQRYEDWRFFWDLPIHRPLNSESIGGPFDNPDGDAYPNLVEWAFVQNPRFFDRIGKPTVGLIQVARPAGVAGTDFYTQITFNVLSDYSNRGLFYIVEAADDAAFSDPDVILVVAPGDSAQDIRDQTIMVADAEGNEQEIFHVMAVMDHHYSYRVTVRDTVRVEGNGERYLRVLIQDAGGM